jgi:hypothetical protein
MSQFEAEFPHPIDQTHKKSFTGSLPRLAESHFSAAKCQRQLLWPDTKSPGGRGGIRGNSLCFKYASDFLTRKGQRHCLPKSGRSVGLPMCLEAVSTHFMVEYPNGRTGYLESRRRRFFANQHWIWFPTLEGPTVARAIPQALTISVALVFVRFCTRTRVGYSEVACRAYSSAWINSAAISQEWQIRALPKVTPRRTPIGLELTA